MISEQLGRDINAAEVQDLGRARRFLATKEESTIIEGKGEAKAISARVNEIRTIRDQSKSDWDREKAEERLGKLSNSVAVIKVGAATEVELKERKHRVEDALSATRAAVEEGIVPGGGVALLSAMSVLGAIELEGDEATGLRILQRSLEEPVRRIAMNAGADGSVVVQDIKSNRKKNFGYDAEKNEFGDMIERGIIDPAMVTRAALENATSIGAMVLTTNVLVAEKKEEKKNGAMPAPPPPY